MRYREIFLCAVLISNVFGQDYNRDGKTDNMEIEFKEGNNTVTFSITDSDYDNVFDSYRKIERYKNGSNMFTAIDDNNDGIIDKYSRMLTEFRAHDLEENPTFLFSEDYEFDNKKLKEVNIYIYEDSIVKKKKYSLKNGKLKIEDFEDQKEFSVLQKLDEPTERDATKEEENEFQEYEKNLDKFQKQKEDIESRLQ